MNLRSGILLLLVSCILSATTVVNAQVPRTLSFQGVLANQSGSPIQNGTHSIMIRLYNGPTDPVAMYTEIHSVTTVGGLFNITIGSVTPIPTTIAFDRPYFIGVSVDNGNELTPRTSITASPYALRSSVADVATMADGLSATATGVVRSVNGKDGIVNIQGGGGTTVTTNGSSLVISSTTGIQTINNTDASMTINNPSGPNTTLSIASGGISGTMIQSGAIYTAHLQDGSVTTSKLASGVIPTSLPPSGAAGGDLAGSSYPNPAIAAGAVTTAKILDGTIVNADISNTAAIAYGKLSLNNSIVTGDLTDNSVTLPKLNTAGAASNQSITYNGTSIGWGNPSPGGAASGDLTGVYPNPTIATGAVNSAKIADGSIVNADVSLTAAIAYSKLNLANSIITGDLTDGAVTLPKMSTSGATSGQGITFNGTNIIWGSPSPGGGAGGDLTGTYPSPTIAPGVVTSAKIADGTIVTVDLADGSVTDAKVANGISYSKLSGAPTSLPPTGAAGGDLTGTYPGPQIAPNAVTSAKILDGTIVNADVSPTAAIAYSKLTLTNSIVNGDLTANSVTSNNVVDGTLITADLADGSVNSAKILDGTIVNADVSPTAAIAYSKLNLTNSIVNGDLTANSVTSNNVVDGTLVTADLADGSVTSAKILDGTIVNADVSPTAAIAYSKLNLTNSLATADHIDGSITLPKLATTGASSGQGITFNGTSIVWGSPSPGGAAGGDLTGTYPNPTIATGAVTSAKIADGTIVDADVSPTAAIAYSKLNLVNSIQNADIVANAITTSKVANGTVTTSKLADSAVSGLKLLTNAVQTAHIQDGNVILPKISNTGASSGQSITFNGTNIVWGSPSPGGAAGGDLTGTYPNPTIATGAVTSAKIADGTIVDADVSPTASIAYSKLNLVNSIQNADIVANAITTSKVANGTVTTSKLADSAVSGLKLLTNAVQTAHIADGNVTLPKVSSTGASSGQSITFNGTNIVWGTPSPGGAAGGDLTGTYPNPTIATGAVTSAKIADGTIVDADVSPTAAIAYSKLNLVNSIQNADIVANAITTSKVANGTVTTSKLADSAVSGLKLLTNAVQTAHIADGNVTLPKISSTGASSGQSIMFNGTNIVWSSPSPGGAAGGDLTGTYPNPVVAANAVTSAKIADGTIVDADVSPTASIAYSKLNLTNSIQNSDIIANAITTSKVANGTVTTSKMADSAISGLKLLTFAVTNRHIADGAVTNAKISGTGASTGQALTFDGTNVVWGTPSVSGTAGGDLTGTYPNPTVANDAISSAKILDGTVTNADVSATASIAYSKLNLTNSIQNADIVANAITTSKVANGTVTTSKMADSAISGLKLLTFAVSNRHIADGAVTNAKISGTGASTGQALTFDGTNVVWGAPSVSGTAGGDLTGTYPNPTVANDAISSAKILDGTVTNADVSATASIAYSKLNLINSIQNADIVANAITTSKVANGTVTTSKMADSAISGLKLLTFAVSNRHIADEAVSLPKIDPTGASSGQVIGYNGSSVAWVNSTSTVTTNATLTGNGSSGSPLGINLGNSNTWTANQTFAGTFLITSNSRIAMTNSDNNARDIRLQEPSGTGSQYIGLRAPSVSNNGNYVLPAVMGTAGQVLTLGSSNSIDSGTMVWSSASTTVNTNATLTGDGSSGSPLGINLSNSNTWTANQTFGGTFLITSNSRIAMTNSDNNARDIRLQEPSGTGTQYIGLRAPSVSNNGNYVLPAVMGTAGQVLTLGSSNSLDSGTMVWSSAGMLYFTESTNSSAPNGTVTVSQLLASGGATNIDVALRPKGTGALLADMPDNAATGGNKRGSSSVDWQMSRTANSQVASGNYAMVLGGTANTASGDYSLAAGDSTTASGDNSTALGNYVSTNSNSGSFIIGDYSTTTVLSSDAADRFTARFDNGYKLYTNSAASVGIQAGNGANSWSTISDSTKKTNFRDANGEQFLSSIDKMKLGSWNYKAQDPQQYRHYGPMAQEFYAAFGHDGMGTVGCDTLIASADIDGVMMIAIKALSKRTQELKAKQSQVDALQAQVDRMQKVIDAYDARMKQMETVLRQVQAGEQPPVQQVSR